MRNNILDIVTEQNDLTHVVIMTFNLDFIFLQTVILPALRRCGHPSLTIFADAQQAFNSYTNQMNWIDGLGMRYRVIPVDLGLYNSFHPKAILLCGEEKGKLLIGSGNLTHGGWVENAEIWNVFDSDEDGIVPFIEIREYLYKIATYIPNTETIKNELSDTFNPDIHEWANNTDDSKPTIIGRFNDDCSTCDAISEIVNKDSFNKLIICSPYYDEKGAMAINLKNRFNIKAIEVLFDSHNHTLTKKAANNLKRNNIKIQPVRFERAQNHGVFVHAKFYGFIEKSKAYVFSGSANCSLAALNANEPGRGNAELLAFEQMSIKDFMEQYVNELIWHDTEQISYYEKEDYSEKTIQDNYFIKIISARFDSHGLTVIFNSSKNMSIQKCFVDEIIVPYTNIDEGKLLIKSVKNPRRIYIEGVNERQEVKSNIMWVDNEFELAVSAKSRSLASVILTGVNPSTWSVNIWIELLDKFHGNLKYTPSWKANPIDRKGDREESEILYSREDIFYDYQGLPEKIHFPPSQKSNNRIMTLQQVLLQCFGHGWKDNSNTNVNSNDDEIVYDEQDVINKTKKEFANSGKTKDDAKTNTLNNKSIRKKLFSIADYFQNKDYILSRSPDLIKVDIAIASVILRTGLHEHWLGENDFIEVTHQIWSALFFSGCDDANMSYTSGWIEYLLVNSPDPADFMNKLCDVELSASLILWALALPQEITSPEGAFFHLVVITSVAKFPNLWSMDNSNSLSESIVKHLQATKKYDSNSFEEVWINISKRWNELLKKGAALAELNKIIYRYNTEDLSKLVNNEFVTSGELLWQSSKYGFCITKKKCKRVSGHSVNVISLHNDNEITISGPYLIPILGLLESIPDDSPIKAISDNSQEVILDFIDELSGKLIQSE